MVLRTIVPLMLLVSLAIAPSAASHLVVNSPEPVMVADGGEPPPPVECGLTDPCRDSAVS